jgi:hypothetical protein
MAQIGAVNKTYISSQAFMDQRDILEEVLDVTSEDATILDIMELTGKFKVTDVPEYSHFENQYLYRAATVLGTWTGGGTNANLVGIIASDQFLGVEQSLPLVGELAMLQNKKIGIVVAVDAGTREITIKPMSAAAGDALGVPAAGQTVIFWSNAQPEGSEDPAGRKPQFTRSENSIQIFKTSAEITDLQKVSKIEVKYGGKNYVMYKLQHDTLQKHRMDIAHAMLVGQKSKTTDTSGEPVYTTQGLRRYILGGDGTVNTSGGHDIPLSSAVSLSNLRTMSRTLDKRGAPKEYWFWTGGDLRADLDDLLIALPGVVNGIVYNSWGIGDGKKRALDVGVNSFKLYGRTFHVKDILAYDNPQVFAATNFNFAGEGYLIPTGKIKADKSGTLADRICVRYMSGDGTDFKHMETLTGKLAPTPTETKSVLKVGYQSIMGLQVAGVRQFGIFSKA